jgi:hypothetical protein
MRTACDSSIEGGHLDFGKTGCLVTGWLVAGIWFSVETNKADKCCSAQARNSSPQISAFYIYEVSVLSTAAHNTTSIGLSSEFKCI